MLHINDVCLSIGSKCRTHHTDITDFPFTDIERFVKVLHSRSDYYGLQAGMLSSVHYGLPAGLQAGMKEDSFPSILGSYP